MLHTFKLLNCSRFGFNPSQVNNAIPTNKNDQTSIKDFWTDGQVESWNEYVSLGLWLKKKHMLLSDT